jgi:hypothetical protein
MLSNISSFMERKDKGDGDDDAAAADDDDDDDDNDDDNDDSGVCSVSTLHSCIWECFKFNFLAKHSLIENSDQPERRGRVNEELICLL